MTDEPDLRLQERAFPGQPQGWGEFPPGKPSRPLPIQSVDAGAPIITLRFRWLGGDGEYTESSA